MSRLIAGLSGLLFGLGLATSGMTNPANVIAFLNLSPGWQPALIFVLGSALLVTLIGYLLSNRNSAPWLEPHFHVPSKTQIDARLLGGAVLFGMGWGLSGYCPGPAIVGAWTLSAKPMIFLGAYLLGNLAYEGFQRVVTGEPTADG